MTENPSIPPRDTVFSLLSRLENCGISAFLEANEGPYERECLEAMLPLFENGGIFIDAGAHIGNHSVFLLQNSSADILAFEPNPAAFSALTQNVFAGDFRARAKLYNLALGDDRSNGRLSPTKDGDPGMLSLIPSQTNANALIVSIFPLDDFIGDIQGDVKVIKIDVEGYECQVVRGAEKIIAAHEPMICAESRTLEEFEALLALMSVMGYVPFALYNSTPTVFWRKDVESAKTLSQDALRPYRYAIKAQTRLNKALVTNGKTAAGQSPSALEVMRREKSLSQANVTPTPDTSQDEAAMQILSRKKVEVTKPTAQPSSTDLLKKVEAEARTKAKSEPETLPPKQDTDAMAKAIFSKSSAAKPAKKKPTQSGKEVVKKFRSDS